MPSNSLSDNMFENKNSATATNDTLTQVLLEPSQTVDDFSDDENEENLVAAVLAENPKASFADNWIKPAAATYIVATGMNVAFPLIFSQTFGRIPVVGEWTANAFKTVFTNTPVPVLDMLMTAGNMANYNNVKSFFVKEDEEGISVGMKVVNGFVFFGTAALIGYTTRLALAANGYTPEEGMIIPVAAIIPPEQAIFIPEPILKTLYLWNQNVFALTTAAQTIVAPVVERGLRSVVPYIRQRFFAPAPIVQPEVIPTADVENGLTPSHNLSPAI